LKELWSLLNLLLPEVFDNKKAFHDWFSKPFQKEGATQNAEDDWLETEKKVITIQDIMSMQAMNQAQGSSSRSSSEHVSRGEKLMEQ
jgi:SNF2 family DNA or RNA helicase